MNIPWNEQEAEEIRSLAASANAVEVVPGTQGPIVTRIPLMKVGRHVFDRASDDVAITEQFIDDLIANTELPIPLDKSEFSGLWKESSLGRYRDGVALGWFTKLEKENGKLIGVLELTEVGLEEFNPDMATVLGYEFESDCSSPRAICASQTATPALDLRY